MVEERMKSLVYIYIYRGVGKTAVGREMSTVEGSHVWRWYWVSTGGVKPGWKLTW